MRETSKITIEETEVMAMSIIEQAAIEICALYVVMFKGIKILVKARE